MSVTVHLTLNGTKVPVELDDDAVAVIRGRPARYLSKRALAERLGVSERTIRTWRERGLPGTRCGREVMFEVDEVDRWIEAQA